MTENNAIPESPITRSEVQAMIDAATATEKARLWNIQCFYAKREDLQVSVTEFASDAFKLALANALGDALDAPLSVGETPKAPWLALSLGAADLVSEEVEVLGAGELILQRLDAILEHLNPVSIHSFSPSVGVPSGTV